MKKIFIIIAIVVAVIAVLFGLVLLMIWQTTTIPDEVMDSYDEAIQMSVNSFPTDLIIYGDDCKLRKKAVFRMIDSIDDESLASSDRYMFKVIIINDLYENADIGDEEIKTLKKYVVDGDYHFYYFGTRYLQKFLDTGICNTSLDSDSCGFGIRHVANRTSYVISQGMWTTENYTIYEENNELLGQIIYIYIERIYHENA